MPTAPKYRRILLKVSGEALMGSGQFGIDIDVIADLSSGLPHMLPDPVVFSSAMRKLGLVAMVAMTLMLAACTSSASPAGAKATVTAKAVAAETATEPVKQFETRSYEAFCLTSSSGRGSLIHATVGSSGGSGRRCRKRTGFVA